MNEFLVFYGQVEKNGELVWAAWANTYVMPKLDIPEEEIEPILFDTPYQYSETKFGARLMAQGLAAELRMAGCQVTDPDEA